MQQAVREKEKERGDRWAEVVKNAKTEGQVWGIINRERKKRGGIDERIKMEEWTGYFRGLMERWKEEW